jgi:predicted Zn-dependent protease
LHGSDFYHTGLNFKVQFPAGWRVDNKPERLLAISPEQDALVEMQTTNKGKVRTPQEYLVVSMKLRDLHNTQAFKVNGLPGYAGMTRLQTPFGPRDTHVAVVFLRGQAFRFFGVARKADQSIERFFLDTVQSLHVLRPADRALARGQHLELTTARAGDNFAKLARRTPLKNDPESILRLLNGKYPQGEPAPGELVKIIR